MSSNPLPITLRDSQESDMAAIQAIYSYYVTRCCASFEEVPPTVEEMIARRAKTLARGLPYLVAESDGEIVGYTYAGPFRVRSAYRYTIEDSIYVAPGVVRRGVGVTLLGGLVRRCTDLGYRQMIGIIGDSANQGSIGVHRKMGFVQEGVLRGVGLKFGRWIDVVIMHRPLGDADEGLPAKNQLGLPPIP
ncbi:GNAT family N-acetyltransferase [Telmatospirillum siberiense]|uniref:GNAT family N-acetyltransferase n=1 Tax=Telmatospirillum siberiense TaxID=382514 RepID=A0A2N3Q1M8_9PROT|nr:GNAT family N-acetyltransferase [Telmatospirillum siberiense]PKU26562.1 GNAT family N-acetyltransferase [Telmatospirillum siberiense]